MALRYDRSPLATPEKLPNGWLRVDGALTRTGVFTYRNPDGTTRREYRSPAEVFKADSLRTFSLVPVTNDHPPVLLDASNTKKYAVGSVSETVRQDGDHVHASMLITDGATVEAVLGGKSELSCGYVCDVEMSPGVSPEGIRYDAEQKNIRGNHVAIVAAGRAGPTARIRLDEGDAEMVDVCHSDDERRDRTMKLNIAGVEVEVSEQAADLIKRERTDAQEKLAVAEKDKREALTKAEKATARADQAEDALKTEKAARLDAQDPAKLDARINARASLLADARAVLGADAKFDGKSDLAVKLDVLAKLCPTVKFDGKSEVYVEARYDAAMEQHVASGSALDKARQAAEGRRDAKSKDEEGDGEDAARMRMMKRNKDAGLNPFAKKKGKGEDDEEAPESE